MTTRTFILLLAALLALISGPPGKVRAADAKQQMNIVLILADDKCELGQSKIENRRKSRAKLRFHARFQITGNCGELRQITGN